MAQRAGWPCVHVPPTQGSPERYVNSSAAVSLLVMLDTPPLDRVRRLTFESALLLAITEGQIPSRAAGLSAHTWSAIEAIALNHPDATVRLITGAYETFERDAEAVA